MLHLVTSNRWEALADALIARLDDTAAAPRSPLEPHTIAVAGLAQRRALAMAVADRHGVAINLRFVFLAQYLWRQMAALVPGIALDTPFDAPTLAWRIDALFDDAGFVGQRPRLAPYLGACSETMRFDFARRTAHAVEQLTTYRSDWLERWSRGHAVPAPAAMAPGTSEHRDWIDDEAWQRALWQRLERDLELPAEHPSRRFVQALERDPQTAAQRLPRELHVMALPAIAPLHLELLAALAQVISVHVYALEPSQAYWGDVVSAKRLAALQARGSSRAIHAETGHPLLAAWGQQMKAQHVLLHGKLDGDVIDDDVFVEPEGHSRLARMQRAVLKLDDGVTLDSAGDHRSDKTTSDKTTSDKTTGDNKTSDNQAGNNDRDAATHDDSVEIHVAHSLRRELEALHQRLLALFAQPHAPLPHEVLLITPDIDAAAPMVDAVFGAAGADARIAFTITGRAGGDDGGASQALLQLIDAGLGRWTAEDLMAFAQLPLVMRRMRWTDDDVTALREWIGAAGMRFGLDAAHRGDLHLPAGDAHTLDDAIDRLLLGHVFARGDEGAATARGNDGDAAALNDAYAGKLPAATVGGSQAALLGSLAALQRSLQHWRAILAAPRAQATHTPADWQRHLLWAIDEFLWPEQPIEHQGLRALRLAIAQWHARLRAAGEARALSATLVRVSLEHELRSRAAGAAPAGNVTFASMTGLRRLPYRVVIAFGLNDGAWGASGAPPEWDLMARAPRPGDRQRRHDERDALLDAMLAARDRFWISWTGRDQRDNHELPPAAVVDEWIEALAAADGVSVAALREHIVVNHPLQPFAPELFAQSAPPRRRSHHRGYAQALQQANAAAMSGTANDRSGNANSSSSLDSDADTDAELDDEGAEEASDGDDSNDATFADHAAAHPLFAHPLAPCPPAQRRITLAQLQAFFTNPAKALLTQRLGIALPRKEDELRSDEPFVLDPRDRARLASRLMPALTASTDRERIVRHALASGVLPAAALGDAVLARELDALDRQAHALAGGDGAAELRSSVPLQGVLPFDVDGRHWQLVIDMTAVEGHGLEIWRSAKLQPKHRLQAWIEHLAMNAWFEHAREPAVAAPLAHNVIDIASHPSRATVDRSAHLATRLVTRDFLVTFEPVTHAMQHLHTLVELMDRGLREPLPFMPDPSWKAVAKGNGKPFQRGDDDADAVQAREEWRDELRDPWVLLAWRGRRLKAEPDFTTTARAVYDALLDHRIDKEQPL